MQKARHSMLEAVFNTASGFAISLAATHYVFVWWGISTAHNEDVTLVSALTVVSIVRSYLWRRLFNWLHVTNRL